MGAQAVFSVVTPTVGAVLANDNVPFSVAGLPAGTQNLTVCLLNPTTGAIVWNRLRPFNGVIAAGATTFSDTVSISSLYLPKGDYDFAAVANPSGVTSTKVRVTVGDPPVVTPTPTPTPTVTPTPTPTPQPVDLTPVMTALVALQASMNQLVASHTPVVVTPPSAGCTFTTVNSSSVYVKCARSEFPLAVTGQPVRVIK